MKSELLRCPFCGGEGTLQEYPYYGIRPAYKVSCQNQFCGVRMKTKWLTKEGAIKAWNRRAGK